MAARSSRNGRGRGARQVKVVVTGPFGAGKTTLIRTMSEIAVLSTERKVSGNGLRTKASTTVAMDFGRLTVDADLQLFLFGTPGQKRFDFMWEILAEGMLGFVVLIDAQRADSFEEAEEILAFFRESASVPFVVAVNKGEREADGGTTRAREWLRLPEQVRCVAVDARDRQSVKDTLLELLYAVLDEVETAEQTAV